MLDGWVPKGGTANLAAGARGTSRLEPPFDGRDRQTATISVNSTITDGSLKLAVPSRLPPVGSR
jgi:hypothetical protein